MKTYTHPTIAMPAGDVVVIFKDPTKTGSVTLSKCIVDIGDVEEGFDYELGELWVPSCSIRFTNKSNELLATMFDTYSLEVEIYVDDELYFIGDVDFESINPNELYEDSYSLIGEFELDALHRFARLRNYRMGDSLTAFDPGSFLYNISSLSDPTTSQFKFGTFFQYAASFMGLKADSASDVNYIRHRQFRFTAPDTSVFTKELKDIVLFRYYLIDTYYNNYYSNKYKDCFGLLGDLAKDFFFYPRIIYDGTNLKLEIVERDIERTITGLNVEKTLPKTKYLFNQINTRLANMPDNFDTTDLIFNSKSSYVYSGDTFLHEMMHTNIERDDGTWFTNMKFRIPTIGSSSTTPDAIINNEPSTVSYDSFQEAMHNAYKNIYLGKEKWRDVVISGMKATWVSSEIRNLTPVYKFSLYSKTHYIHSVNKSLMNNRSTLTCLVLD